VVEPSFDTDEFAEPGDGCVGGIPEKVHAYAEEYRIQQSGDNDPFPQPVFADEMVGFGIGLEGNYNLFKQN
jgi:hypothetical protein